MIHLRENQMKEYIHLEQKESCEPEGITCEVIHMNQSES